MNRLFFLLRERFLRFLQRTLSLVSSLVLGRRRSFSSPLLGTVRLDRIPAFYPSRIWALTSGGCRMVHRGKKITPHYFTELGTGHVGFFHDLRFSNRDFFGRSCFLTDSSELHWISTICLAHWNREIYGPSDSILLNLLDLRILGDQSSFETDTSRFNPIFSLESDPHDELPLRSIGFHSLSADIISQYLSKYGSGGRFGLSSFLGETFDDNILDVIFGRPGRKFVPLTDSPSPFSATLPLLSLDLFPEEIEFLNYISPLPSSSTSRFHAWLFSSSTDSVRSTWSNHLNRIPLEFGRDWYILRKELQFECWSINLSSLPPTDNQLEFFYESSRLYLSRDNFFILFHRLLSLGFVRNPFFAYLLVLWIYNEFTPGLLSNPRLSSSPLMSPISLFPWGDRFFLVRNSFQIRFVSPRRLFESLYFTSFFRRLSVTVSEGRSAHSALPYSVRYHRTFLIDPSNPTIDLFKTNRFYLRSCFLSSQNDLDRFLFLLIKSQFFFIFNLHKFVFDLNLTLPKFLIGRRISLIRSLFRAKVGGSILLNGTWENFPYGFGWPGSPWNGPLSSKARHLIDHSFAEYQYGGFSPLTPYNFLGDPFTPRMGRSFLSYFPPRVFYEQLNRLSPVVSRLLATYPPNPFPSNYGDYRIPTFNRGISFPLSDRLSDGLNISKKFTSVFGRLVYFYNSQLNSRWNLPTSWVTGELFRFHWLPYRFVLENYRRNVLGWPEPLDHPNFDSQIRPSIVCWETIWTNYEQDIERPLPTVAQAIDKFSSFYSDLRLLRDLFWFPDFYLFSTKQRPHCEARKNENFNSNRSKFSSLLIRYSELFRPSDKSIDRKVEESFWEHFLNRFKNIFLGFCSSLRKLNSFLTSLATIFNSLRIFICSRILNFPFKLNLEINWHYFPPFFFVFWTFCILSLFHNSIFSFFFSSFSFLMYLFENPLVLFYVFQLSYDTGTGKDLLFFGTGVEDIELLWSFARDFIFFHSIDSLLLPGNLDLSFPLGVLYSINSSLISAELSQHMSGLGFTGWEDRFPDLDSFNVSIFSEFFEVFTVENPLSLPLVFLNYLVGDYFSYFGLDYLFSRYKGSLYYAPTSGLLNFFSTYYIFPFFYLTDSLISILIFLFYFFWFLVLLLSQVLFLIIGSFLYIRIVSSLANFTSDLLYTIVTFMSFTNSSIRLEITVAYSELLATTYQFEKFLGLRNFYSFYLSNSSFSSFSKLEKRLVLLSVNASPISLPRNPNFLTGLFFLFPLISPSNSFFGTWKELFLFNRSLNSSLDRFISFFFSLQLEGFRSQSSMYSSVSTNSFSLAGFQYRDYFPVFFRFYRGFLYRDEGNKPCRSLEFHNFSKPSTDFFEKESYFKTIQRHLEMISAILGCDVEQLLAYLEVRSPSIVKSFRDLNSKRPYCRPSRPFSNVSRQSSVFSEFDSVDQINSRRPVRGCPDVLGGGSFLDPSSLIGLRGPYTLNPSYYNLSDVIFEFLMYEFSDISRLASGSLDSGLAHFFVVSSSKSIIAYQSQLPSNVLSFFPSSPWYIHAVNSIPWFESPDYGCFPDFHLFTLEELRTYQHTRVSFKDLIRVKAGLPPRKKTADLIEFTPVIPKIKFLGIHRNIFILPRTMGDYVSLSENLVIYSYYDRLFSFARRFSFFDLSIFFLSVVHFNLQFCLFFYRLFLKICTREFFVFLPVRFYAFLVSFRENFLRFYLISKELLVEVGNLNRFGSEDYVISRFEKSLDPWKSMPMDPGLVENYDSLEYIDEEEFWLEQEDEDSGFLDFMSVSILLPYYILGGFDHSPTHPISQLKTFFSLLVGGTFGIYPQFELIKLRSHILFIRILKVPYILNSLVGISNFRVFTHVFSVFVGLLFLPISILALLGFLDGLLFPWYYLLIFFLMKYVKPAIVSLYFLWFSFIFLFLLRFLSPTFHLAFFDSDMKYFPDDASQLSSDLDSFVEFVEDFSLGEEGPGFLNDWYPDPISNPEGYSRRLVHRDVFPEANHGYQSDEPDNSELENILADTSYDDPFTLEQRLEHSSKNASEVRPLSSDSSYTELERQNLLELRHQRFSGRLKRRRFVSSEESEGVSSNLNLFSFPVLLDRFFSFIGSFLAWPTLLFLDRYYYGRGEIVPRLGKIIPYLKDYSLYRSADRTFDIPFSIFRKRPGEFSFAEPLDSYFRDSHISILGFETELKIDTLISAFDNYDPVSKYQVSLSRSLAIRIFSSFKKLKHKFTPEEVKLFEERLVLQEIPGSPEGERVKQFIYWSNSDRLEGDPDYFFSDIFGGREEPLWPYIIFMFALAYENYVLYGSELEINKSSHLSAFYSRLSRSELVEFSRFNPAKSACGIHYEGFSKKYYRSLLEVTSNRTKLLEKYGHDINLYPYYPPIASSNCRFNWNSSAPRLLRIKPHGGYVQDLPLLLIFRPYKSFLSKEGKAPGYFARPLVIFARTGLDLPQFLSLPPVNHVSRDRFIFPHKKESIPFLADYRPRLWGVHALSNTDSAEMYFFNNFPFSIDLQRQRTLINLGSLVNDYYQAMSGLGTSSVLIHDSPFVRYGRYGGLANQSRYMLSFFRKNSYYYDLMHSSLVPASPRTFLRTPNSSVDPVLGRIFYPPVQISPIRSYWDLFRNYPRFPFELYSSVGRRLSNTRLDRFPIGRPPLNSVNFLDVRSPSPRAPLHKYAVQNTESVFPMVSFNERRLSPYLKNTHSWSSLDRLGNFPSTTDFGRSGPDFYKAGLPTFFAYGRKPIVGSVSAFIRKRNSVQLRTGRLRRYDSIYVPNNFFRGRQFDPYVANFSGVSGGRPGVPARRGIKRPYTARFFSHRNIPEHLQWKRRFSKARTAYRPPTVGDFSYEFEPRNWSNLKRHLFHLHLVHTAKGKYLHKGDRYGGNPVNYMSKSRYHDYLLLPGRVSSDLLTVRSYSWPWTVIDPSRRYWATSRLLRFFGPRTSEIVTGHLLSTSRYYKDPRLLELGYFSNRIPTSETRFVLNRESLEDYLNEMPLPVRFVDLISDRSHSRVNLARRRFLEDLYMARWDRYSDLSSGPDIDVFFKRYPRFRYSFLDNVYSQSYNSPLHALAKSQRAQIMIAAAFDPVVTPRPSKFPFVNSILSRYGPSVNELPPKLIYMDRSGRYLHARYVYRGDDILADALKDLIFSVPRFNRPSSIRRVQFLNPLTDYSFSHHPSRSFRKGFSGRLGYLDPYSYYGGVLPKFEIFGPHRSLVERSARSSRADLFSYLFYRDRVPGDVRNSYSSYSNRFMYLSQISRLDRLSVAEFRSESPLLGTDPVFSNDFKKFNVAKWPIGNWHMDSNVFDGDLNFLPHRVRLAKYHAHQNEFLPPPAHRTTLINFGALKNRIDYGSNPFNSTPLVKWYSGSEIELNDRSLRGFSGLGYRNLAKRYPRVRFRISTLESNARLGYRTRSNRWLSFHTHSRRRRNLKIRSHRFLSDSNDYYDSISTIQSLRRPLHGRLFNNGTRGSRLPSLINNACFGLFDSLGDFFYFSYINFIDFYNLYYLFNSIISLIFFSPLVLAAGFLLWTILLNPIIVLLSFFGLAQPIYSIFLIFLDIFTWFVEIILWFLSI